MGEKTTLKNTKRMFFNDHAMYAYKNVDGMTPQILQLSTSSKHLKRLNAGAVSHTAGSGLLSGLPVPECSVSLLLCAETPCEIYQIYTERQKSCSTFSLDFFLLKIDDFKNQCSLVFMPVQRTIVAEKSV